MSGDEFDINEWFDVYRLFYPDATREEYESEWNKFQQYKAEYLARKAIQ